MRNFITQSLAKLGMFGLIALVTGLIVFLAAVIEYVSYWSLGTSTRPEGWLMLVVMPIIFAPPLLYVMLNQFRQLDERQQQLLSMHAELQLALGEVKELRGMLSMCAGCKKVRDINNQWVHIDVYLKHNTHADISHGLCPNCADAYR